MNRRRHPSLDPKPGVSPTLTRRTPLNPIGKKAEEKFAEKFNGYHVQYVCSLACVGLPDGSHAEACRVEPHLNFRPGKVRGRNEPSHVIRRSRGGLFFHLVPQSSACHDVFELMPPAERQKLLPLALRLAWTSHHKHPDLVPEPPVPEEEIDAL